MVLLSVLTEEDMKKNVISTTRLRLRDHECSVLKALRTLCNYKVTYLLRQAFIVPSRQPTLLLKRCIVDKTRVNVQRYLDLQYQ